MVIANMFWYFFTYSSVWSSRKFSEFSCRVTSWKCVFFESTILHHKDWFFLSFYDQCIITDFINDGSWLIVVINPLIVVWFMSRWLFIMSLVIFPLASRLLWLLWWIILFIRACNSLILSAKTIVWSAYFQNSFVYAI